MTRPQEKVIRGAVPILIIIATAAVFLPALRNDFVNWDDYATVAENLTYRGLGRAQLEWMFTTFYMGHYQPLSWVTFGVDYLFWGMKPAGYHLTNIILHAVNAGIFYFLALRLLALAKVDEDGTRLRAGAAIAALFFSLHPLRVESVAWATERRDVLSGVFFL